MPTQTKRDGFTFKHYQSIEEARNAGFRFELEGMDHIQVWGNLLSDQGNVMGAFCISLYTGRMTVCETY